MRRLIVQLGWPMTWSRFSVNTYYKTPIIKALSAVYLGLFTTLSFQFLVKASSFDG